VVESNQTGGGGFGAMNTTSVRDVLMNTASTDNSPMGQLMAPKVELYKDDKGTYTMSKQGRWGEERPWS